MKDLEQEAREYAEETTFYHDAYLAAMAGYIAGSLAERKRSEWIPVTERLPDSKRDVLGIVKLMNGKYAVIICNYTKGNEIQVYDSSGDDEYFLEAGWYECEEQSGGDFDEQYFERTVVGWMELPSTESITPKENL